MRVIVLGAGLVGGAIVRDLASERDWEVAAVDIDQCSLDKLKDASKVKTVKADLSDSSKASELVRIGQTRTQRCFSASQRHSA